MGSELISRARAGDGAAFDELAGPYRRELHLYCYRMLGSVQEAEDAVQDTLLAARHGVRGFTGGRAAVRTWLYRIATYRCLRARRAATARSLRAYTRPGAQPPGPARLGGIVCPGPYPDALLEDMTELPPGSPARYKQAESISLDFVAALQGLAGHSLAVLILCDIAGFHASQAAGMVDLTAESATRTLEQARASLQRRLAAATPGQPPPAAGSPAEEAITAAFARAWESADLGALTALLTGDVVISMPPMPFEHQGRDVAAGFFACLFDAGSRFGLVPTRANGQPAFGAYAQAPTGLRHGTGLYVLTLAGDRIRVITRFDKNLFPWFGLPRSLPN